MNIKRLIAPAAILFCNATLHALSALFFVLRHACVYFRFRLSGREAVRQLSAGGVTDVVLTRLKPDLLQQLMTSHHVLPLPDCMAGGTRCLRVWNLKHMAKMVKVLFHAIWRVSSLTARRVQIGAEEEAQHSF